MRRLRTVAIAAGVLLGLGVVGLVCQRVAERGRFAVPYSTYGSGPEGSRALYLLAERLGARPMRWAEDLGRLPSGGMLVALGGCNGVMHRGLSRYERRALQEWIEEGGVLLVAGARQYLPKELGVWLHRKPGTCAPGGGLAGLLEGAADAGPDAGADGGVRRDEGPPLHLLPTDEPEPPVRHATPRGETLAGIGTVPLRRPATIRTGDDVEVEPLLQLDDEPAGVVARRGDGAIVVLGSASLFANGSLSADRGGVVFARLADRFAPKGPILFDEYHIGMGTQRSIVRYIHQIGGTAVLLQLLVFAGLLLWRGGTRFGAMRGPAPAPPVGTASYVEGVGQLYRKARDPGGTLGIVVRHALSQVARHHHMPPADAETLASGLDERGRRKEARAVRALGALERSDTAGRRRSLVANVREVDALVASATAERSGGSDESKPALQGRQESS